MEVSTSAINEAARLLRVEIDSIHNKLVDETASLEVADTQTKDLYDAVTLLHEQAMKAGI
jgi:hypothetical protein